MTTETTAPKAGLLHGRLWRASRFDDMVYLIRTADAEAPAILGAGGWVPIPPDGGDVDVETFPTRPIAEAYARERETRDDIRDAVKDMCRIIADDAATAAEQRAALLTLIDAMAPEILESLERK